VPLEFVSTITAGQALIGLASIVGAAVGSLKLLDVHRQRAKRRWDAKVDSERFERHARNNEKQLSEVKTAIIDLYRQNDEIAKVLREHSGIDAENFQAMQRQLTEMATESGNRHAELLKAINGR